MTSEYPLVPLGHVAKLQSGYPFRSTGWTTAGCPVIKIGNLKRGRIDPKECSFVTEATARQAMDWWSKPGDVLLAMTGAYVGEAAWVRDHDRFLINQRIGRFTILRPDLLAPRYLFYFLRLPEVFQLIQSVARGSAQPNLSARDVDSETIPLPPLEMQRKLTAPLGLMDDRIDVLDEANTTLEWIAQAIFRSWFIDFDPVRAKAEGREPEGMGAAAVFPSEFAESVLGPIPKGWNCMALGDVALFCRGTVNPMSTPDGEFEHYSIPAYDTGQVPVIERGADIRSQKVVVPEGTVLLSKLNPNIPRVWFPGHAGMNAVCSTEFIPLKPCRVSKEYLYFLLKQRTFMAALQTLVTGTSNSHQRVEARQIAAMPVVVPPAGVMAAFTSLVGPMLSRLVEGRLHAQTLMRMRDELLPRLISGKLPVPQGISPEEVLA